MPVSERLKSEHIPVPTIDSQLRLSSSGNLNIGSLHSSSQSRSFGSVSSGGREHVAIPRLLRSPTFEPQRTPPARPIQPRSISFDNVPTHPANTTPGSSRRRRLTSGLLQMATPEEQPWSLFGQAMESGGQLRSLESPRLRRSGGDQIQFDNERASVSGFGEGLSDPFLATIVEPPPSRSSWAGSGRRVRTNGSCESHATPKQVQADLQDYESDTTTDGEEEEESPQARPVLDSTKKAREQKKWLNLRFPHLPVLQRNILKCALAYFVASLFTFSPYLSGLISDIASYGAGERRPSPSGHMVATIAVYFNPAKTVGGMIEADIYCLLGLVYSALVCMGTMSMFWWLDVKPGWEWLADASVILWLGVAVSAVAWMKVWMAKPSFNTACSMTAIILFIVIVKEGGAETLLQVCLIVLAGSIVSNLVCYCIWPQSARFNLQGNMIRTLDSFSTLLTILTDTFLLEEPLHQPSHEKLQRSVDNHQSSFTSLKKNLAEAHSEWFYGGPTGTDHGSSGTAYQDAVDCLNRLAQHLNGLRGGTRLQYELTKACNDRKLHDRPQGPGKGKSPDRNNEFDQDVEDDQLLDQAIAIFGELVDDLGAPLKALSTTCTSSLKRLREAFAGQQRTGHKAIKPQEFHQLIDGIEEALSTFETISNDAVMRHYLKSEQHSAHNSVESLVEENLADIGSDSEHVFLVYFFIFTLQEFARELVSLIDAMERIYNIEQERLTGGRWWTHAFSIAKNLKLRSFWMGSADDKHERRQLQRSLSSIILSRSGHITSSFPKIRPHAPNTIQTPSRSQLTFIGRVKQALWSIGSRLKERDLKYAVKAGMATGILAAPAFFDATRPLFTEYRGEWALISFFVVISPTIGATNFMSVHRILGTLFGAGVAAGIFSLFPGNPVILSIFGFFFALPCFYCIVATPEYATSGRFVLLTYNLTCLYCYNLRQVDVSVGHVAFHRSVSVIVGVIWAALVSRLWWPSEARRELSKALGEFCLNIGWLYTRLVASNSFSYEMADVGKDASESGRGPSLLSRHTSTELDASIREFMAMELHLQIKLIELQGLLAQTQHEPRLKGPFPVALYRSILTSLQSILDKLHSMRCVTTREEWLTSVRQDFIYPVRKERREMVGNIILSFSTLASAFRLKAPLPPYLPPAEESRQRLVDAIRQLDVVKNRDVRGSRHLLYFAYALTMKGVTRELEYLGSTLQDAFGVIGPSREDFEALFREQREVVEQRV